MIPGSYITVSEGTWHSFCLSTKLLLLTMMMMMMKSPYTSATIEMEISPREGFSFEEHESINIQCQFNLSNPASFVLIRNGIIIVHMEYDKLFKYFKTINDTSNFDCSVYKQGHSSNFWCTKTNLTCDDAASYSCSVNNSYNSSPKTIPVKSYLESLEYVNGSSKWSNIEGCLCRAITTLDPGSQVTFKWKILDANYVAKTAETKATVPDLGKCYSEVSSFVSCDMPEAAYISCSAFDQERRMEGDADIRASSAPSGIFYTKWILGANLILLLLLVAISR